MAHVSQRGAAAQSSTRGDRVSHAIFPLLRQHGPAERQKAACSLFYQRRTACRPGVQYGADYDLSALVSLVREWSADRLMTEYPLATFLITENLSDLHSLLVNNPRAGRIKIPLPSTEELTGAIQLLSSSIARRCRSLKASLIFSPSG